MDPTSYIRFLLALILVLGLILALAWGLKRLGIGEGAAGPLTRRRRLKMVESIMLDGRHRAVIVRRDDVEHLVLIGPNTSQVIETGISAPAASGETTAPVATAGSMFRQLLGKSTAS